MRPRLDKVKTESAGVISLTSLVICTAQLGHIYQKQLARFPLKEIRCTVTQRPRDGAKHTETSHLPHPEAPFQAKLKEQQLTFKCFVLFRFVLCNLT